MNAALTQEYVHRMLDNTIAGAAKAASLSEHDARQVIVAFLQFLPNSRTELYGMAEAPWEKTAKFLADNICAAWENKQT